MEKYVTSQGVGVYRTTSDINGNPRYIVHFLSIGLDNAQATNLTRKAGLSKYRGKDFGGGFVFQSYNIDSSMDFILKTIKGGK